MNVHIPSSECNQAVYDDDHECKREINDNKYLIIKSNPQSLTRSPQEKSVICLSRKYKNANSY